MTAAGRLDAQAIHDRDELRSEQKRQREAAHHAPSVDNVIERRAPPSAVGVPFNPHRGGEKEYRVAQHHPPKPRSQVPAIDQHQPKKQAEQAENRARSAHGGNIAREIGVPRTRP